ncbi:MAG: PQQ-binding-like beta-propeller repeat protein [Sedimentisphaerales bacterium]
MKKRRWFAITDNRFAQGLLMALTILLASVSQGQEWTRFRGPNGQGIPLFSCPPPRLTPLLPSEEGKGAGAGKSKKADTIPVKWTEKDYNWKVKLPGGGHSSPVIWQDKVFVTSGDQKAGRGILLALRVSDGKALWQKEYTLTTYHINKLNSYATATPAVDADHIYTLWATAKQTLLVALDHDGNEVWRRSFEGVHCQHGAGSSPIVFEDMVVFTHEHEDKYSEGNAQSTWMAVDCKTGQTRWKLPRETSAKTSYSTPCVYSAATDSPQLIFTSLAHGMTGVDPGTGQVIWEVKSAFMSRVVSSPVIASGLLIGTCGDGSSGKRLIAIKPGKKDKSAPPIEAYKIDNSSTPYVPTSLAKDGLLFTFHDRGYVSCLCSATGEQLWREKPAERFYSSPVYVNGRLYCITIDGEVVVIEAASTYKLLAVNPLRENSHATAAIAGGRMYLRTFSHLISIGGKKE